MDPMEPIAGLSLERYAQLSAKMKDTGGDMEKCYVIAEAEGVSRADFDAAMKGWTARMSDPATAGQVAGAFMPLYQAAMAEMRGGAEPATLEQYARVVSEYSYEKDANGVQIPVADVLARYGYDQAKWNEITSYWTPKINDQNDPAALKFRELAQKESDRIFGITR